MDKWLVSALRERLIWDYLTAWMLRHGYVLQYVGLGVADTRLIQRYFEGADEALDFRIATFDGRVIGYLDATGYRNPKKAKIDGKRCIACWKLEKAGIIRDRLGIPYKNIWYAHFTDDFHILALINAERLSRLVNAGIAVKRRLYEDERPSYCLDLHYWIPPKRFIQLLQQATR